MIFGDVHVKNLFRCTAPGPSGMLLLDVRVVGVGQNPDIRHVDVAAKLGTFIDRVE